MSVNKAVGKKLGEKWSVCYFTRASNVGDFSLEAAFNNFKHFARCGRPIPHTRTHKGPQETNKYDRKLPQTPTERRYLTTTANPLVCVCARPALEWQEYSSLISSSVLMSVVLHEMHKNNESIVSEEWDSICSLISNTFLWSHSKLFSHTFTCHIYTWECAHSNTCVWHPALCNLIRIFHVPLCTHPHTLTVLWFLKV